MFNKKSFYKPRPTPPLGDTYHDELVVDYNSGSVVTKRVPDNKELPPLENYSLKNLMRSGVDLKRVNTLLPPNLENIGEC